MLPAGALHPGLVDRLADETAKTAAQMLTMCIRALDYCPAVDITFGEYLRAMITADIDSVSDDPPLPAGVHGIVPQMEAAAARRAHGVRGDAGLEHARRPVAGLAARAARQIDLSWNQKLKRLRSLCAQRGESLEAVAADERAFDGQTAISTGSSACCPTCRATTATARCSGKPKGQSTFDVFGVRPTRRVEPDGSFRTEVIAIVHQRLPMRSTARTGRTDGFGFGAAQRSS